MTRERRENPRLEVERTASPQPRAGLSSRRLLGIDRSGPPPEETLAGRALNPWTVPNAIEFARLAAIPGFLAIALSSRNGHSVLAFVVFAAIAVADYLDGFVARLTGQYSRLGALLDPVTDRILVVSGMVVAWHFSLLPRWAIAVVIARELVMVALSRYGLSRGVELKINWPGRIGVAPAMAAPGAALLDLHQVALVMLYVGMALGLLASVLYVRDGIRQIQTRNELPKVSS
jgi:cardiolipin synthase